MEFKYDFLTLGCNPPDKFALEGISLPSSRDVYFRAKQSEITDLYGAARMFLEEKEYNTDWRHWFEPVDDPDIQKAFIIKMRSLFYETALFYYNAIVDISWTMCYVCAEFAVTQSGERVEFGNIQPIENAYDLLRKAEGNVTNPTAEGNPFCYIKRMRPEFSDVIDSIISFWEEFGNSSIRHKFNYCKHKGKPVYSELNQFYGPRFMRFYKKEGSGKRTELAVSPLDVQYTCSLEDSITELLEFDNEKLFPYISDLINKLERIVDPSPLVR